MIDTVLKIKKVIFERIDASNYLVQKLKYKSKLPKLLRQDEQIIEDIKFKGVAITSLRKLSLPLDANFVKAINTLVAELRSGQAQESKVSEDLQSALCHLTYYEPIKIAREFPVVLEWGLQDRILDIVDNIIGVPCAFVGLIVRKEVLNNQEAGTRRWHIDSEDHSTVKIIIYLNDVDERTGPFQYVPIASTPWWMNVWRLNILNFVADDTKMRKLIPAARWQTCTGKAGQVIFAKTSRVFHRGKMPEHTRVAVVYTYTSRSPKFPELCKLETFRDALKYYEGELNQRQVESIYNADILLNNLSKG